MSRWYRAYEGTVTDAKLGEVALVAECSRSVAIAAWHCLLESAAAMNDGGKFDCTPRRVAVILCEAPTVIEAVMAEMAALGMIADGAICAWSRRQYEADSSTERSRKHRERKRNADATQEQQPRNVAATAMQRCATPPDTETETDTENTSSSDEVDAREKISASARTRGCRLPIDWQPEPLAGEIAASVNAWPAGALERELSRFRDWAASATGTNAVKSNWQAAWRNWVRRAEDEGRHAKPISRPIHGNRPALVDIGRAVAADLERKAAASAGY